MSLYVFYIENDNIFTFEWFPNSCKCLGSKKPIKVQNPVIDIIFPVNEKIQFDLILSFVKNRSSKLKFKTQLTFEGSFGYRFLCLMHRITAKKISGQSLL